MYKNYFGHSVKQERDAHRSIRIFGKVEGNIGKVEGDKKLGA